MCAKLKTGTRSNIKSEGEKKILNATLTMKERKKKLFMTTMLSNTYDQFLHSEYVCECAFVQSEGWFDRCSQNIK